MMKKTIPKKLKGTVLFTVVSVMMVLIVFLVATLALASTASKRAYTSYQQEQTEYTAKAIMNAVVEQVRTDSSTGPGSIRQDIFNTAVGASASFDVTVSDGVSNETHPVTITNTGDTRSVYDTATAAWKTIGMYRLSVTVASDTTTAESTYESFLGIDITTTPGTTPPTPPTASDGGAFVSLGDTGGNELATKGYTTGGTYLGIDNPDYSFTMSSSGSNVIDAPFYVNGNLYVPSKFHMHFTKPDDFMIVRGDFSAQNNDIQTDFAGYNNTGEDYASTPYIYVEGKMSSHGSKFTFGDTNNPREHAVNLYCGSMEIDQNGFELCGDLYLMDEGAESVIKSSGAATKLYQWASGTYTRSDTGVNTQYGNIYCNGSLKVEDNNGLQVGGNVQVMGDLTVSNLTVDGDVVVNGTLTVTGNLNCSGRVLAGNMSGNINAAGGKQTAADLGLPATTVTNTKQIYYTDVQTWINTKLTEVAVSWWADNEYDVQAVYVEHVVDPATGAETVTNHGDPFNPGATYYWGRETIVGKSVFDPADPAMAAYPSIHDYLLNTNELYRNLQTANSLATAATVVETKEFFDFSTVYGSDIYPQQYTKDYLNNGDPANGIDAKLEHPHAANYEAMYPTSIDDLDPTIYSGGMYNVPVYSTAGASPSMSHSYVEGHHVSDLDPTGLGYYRVTSNCVLNGYFGQNIFIDGSVGNLTVVMENVQMEGNNGASIIVNDANSVTIFIVGSLTLGTAGQGTSLITTDYLDAMLGAGNWDYTSNLKGVASHMNNDIQVAQIQNVGDPLYPNVIIHSDDNANLNVENNGLVVGLVRAPKLVYNGGQAAVANQTLEYVLPTGEIVNYGSGYSINSDGCNAVGLIGQLIAGKIQLSSTGSWGMLYITSPAGPGPSPLPGTPPPGTPTPTVTNSTFAMLYGNMY